MSHEYDTHETTNSVVNNAESRPRGINFRLANGKRTPYYGCEYGCCSHDPVTMNWHLSIWHTHPASDFFDRATGEDAETNPYATHEHSRSNNAYEVKTLDDGSTVAVRIPRFTKRRLESRLYVSKGRMKNHRKFKKHHSKGMRHNSKRLAQMEVGEYLATLH